jgi:metallophosphoesterase (TIGR00282 family)
MKLLFLGDIVAEPGLRFLERTLSALRADLAPDFIVANAENLAPQAGMTRATLERLFALGVDTVTGGNHSWDGPEGATVHDDERVLRPLNRSSRWPGRGARILENVGLRLGVVSVASRTAIPDADTPLLALEAQLTGWRDATDAVLVDFHGESVFEKLSLAFALDGQVSAFFGTHTHVQTADLRVLPADTAYVSDVGMVGAGDGIQGYAPHGFVERFRTQGFSKPPKIAATGAVEFGAVFLELVNARVVRFERIAPITSERESAQVLNTV